MLFLTVFLYFLVRYAHSEAFGAAFEAGESCSAVHVNLVVGSANNLPR